MKYYCLNDRFAYCKGQPQKNNCQEAWRVVPYKDTEGKARDTLERSVPCCDLNIANCGKHLKSSEK